MLAQAKAGVGGPRLEKRVRARPRVARNVDSAFTWERAVLDGMVAEKKENAKHVSKQKQWSQLRGVRTITGRLMRACRVGTFDAGDSDTEIGSEVRRRWQQRLQERSGSQNPSSIWSEGTQLSMPESSWSGQSFDSEVGGGIGETGNRNNDNPRRSAGCASTEARLPSLQATSPTHRPLLLKDFVPIEQ